MDPWYEILSLVGSHIIMIPIIIICIKHGLLDIATYAGCMTIASTFYHITQTGVWSFESLKDAQDADHFCVNTLIFVVLLLFLQFPRDERIIYTVIMQTLMIMFKNHLVARLHFHYAFMIIGIFGFFIRFYVYPGQRRKYGITYIIIGTILYLISLVFFFFNDGVGEPNYWWAHSGWHFFSMFATNFVLLGFIYHVNYVWKTIIPKLENYFEI